MKALDRYIEYLDINVLEASKQRIKHLIHTFDHLLVAFSGGKDSLVVLNLVEQVYQELKINHKPKVFFRDEELIPDDVIDFVNTIRLSGRFDFYYFCIQLESEKYVLGKKETYIQWDRRRKHIRPIPAYAITCEQVLNQYSTDEFIAQSMNLKGRVAILTGVRADESLVRLQSLLVKKDESYVCDSSSPRVKLCKPIYDWKEKDVFRFFYEYGIHYCQIYNFQMFAEQKLRVSTPLHAESAKELHKLKAIYPIFYAQLCNIFPDIRLQERYFKEIDRNAIIYKYPHTFAGIIEYINDNIDDPKHRKKAIAEVIRCQNTRKNQMSSERPYGGVSRILCFSANCKWGLQKKYSPKTALCNTPKMERL